MDYREGVSLVQDRFSQNSLFGLLTCRKARVYFMAGNYRVLEPPQACVANKKQAGQDCQNSLENVSDNNPQTSFTSSVYNTAPSMIIDNEDHLRDPKSPSASHRRCPGKLKDLNVQSGFRGNTDINQMEHERDDQCDFFQASV